MRKLILFLVMFGILSFAYGQADKLNGFDTKGKKDGKWMLYYNKEWKVVDDSSKAYYCFYTHYNHGARMHTRATWGTKGGKLQDSTVGDQHFGKIKLLDGKYTWLDKEGKAYATLSFNKGEPVSWKQFYPSGKLYMYFDYTKECEGKPLSYYVYVYDKQGKLIVTKPIIIQENGKWPIT